MRNAEMERQKICNDGRGAQIEAEMHGSYCCTNTWKLSVR